MRQNMCILLLCIFLHYTIGLPRPNASGPDIGCDKHDHYFAQIHKCVGLVTQKKVNRSEGDKICRKRLDGHLASLAYDTTTEDTIEYLRYAKFSTRQWFWFGLERIEKRPEINLVWSDRDKYSTHYPDRLEPTSPGLCVVMVFDISVANQPIKWSYWNCSGKHRAICQYDYNECRNKSDCQETCVNKKGYGYCECPQGFQLHNETHCEVDVCYHKGGCDQKCKNINGVRQCSCYAGFGLHNGTDCHDEHIPWEYIIPPILMALPISIFIAVMVNKRKRKNNRPKRKSHKSPASVVQERNVERGIGESTAPVIQDVEGGIGINETRADGNLSHFGQIVRLSMISSGSFKSADSERGEKHINSARVDDEDGEGETQRTSQGLNITDDQREYVTRIDKTGENGKTDEERGVGPDPTGADDALDKNADRKRKSVTFASVTRETKSFVSAKSVETNASALSVERKSTSQGEQIISSARSPDDFVKKRSNQSANDKADHNDKIGVGSEVKKDYTEMDEEDITLENDITTAVPIQSLVDLDESQGQSSTAVTWMGRVMSIFKK